MFWWEEEGEGESSCNLEKRKKKSLPPGLHFWRLSMWPGILPQTVTLQWHSCDYDVSEVSTKSEINVSSTPWICTVKWLSLELISLRYEVDYVIVLDKSNSLTLSSLFTVTVTGTKFLTFLFSLASNLSLSPFLIQKQEICLLFHSSTRQTVVVICSHFLFILS